MEFTLTCMVRSDDVRGVRKVSVNSRARWSMVLGEGTLSILDPVDDLVFKHGASFAGEFSLTAVDGDPQWWRKGWTMRWLQAPNDFYAATGTMRLNAHKAAHMASKKHPRWMEVWGVEGTVEGVPNADACGAPCV
eukprot:scaffold12118_cov75-Phaeocystis_antarctica.AAC.2